MNGVYRVLKVVLNGDVLDHRLAVMFLGQLYSLRFSYLYRIYLRRIQWIGC